MTKNAETKKFTKTLLWRLGFMPMTTLVVITIVTLSAGAPFHVGFGIAFITSMCVAVPMSIQDAFRHKKSLEASNEYKHKYGTDEDGNPLPPPLASGDVRPPV